MSLHPLDEIKLKIANKGAEMTLPRVKVDGQRVAVVYKPTLGFALKMLWLVITSQWAIGRFSPLNADIDESDLSMDDWIVRQGKNVAPHAWRNVPNRPRGAG
ncbi:MAG: hypothetical protein AAF529_16590 [Pseudomonadota bacterium]